MSNPDHPTSPGPPRQRHRWALGTFLAVAAVFLLLTGLFTLPPLVLRVLYVVLGVSALYLMWETMSVMIHKRPPEEDE